MPESVQDLYAAITIAALFVAATQIIFFWNMLTSIWNGKKAPHNPWNANSLEWRTEQTPPVHGNWGDELPVVHRWAYDYSVPGRETDFVPQDEPVREGGGEPRARGRSSKAGMSASAKRVARGRSATATRSLSTARTGRRPPISSTGTPARSPTCRTW